PAVPLTEPYAGLVVDLERVTQHLHEPGAAVLGEPKIQTSFDSSSTSSNEKSSSSEERTPSVLAEHFPHRPAHLADRRAVPQGVLDRVEQVTVARRDGLEVAEAGLH